jgi:hypothetical protein
MSFKPENHIIGKAYDLTQENMNAIIVAFEKQKKENDRLRAALEKIIYKCYLCDKGFKSFPCSCGEYGTIEEIVREALEDK